jgi:DNA-binding transcriptional ArsR family regulator
LLLSRLALRWPKRHAQHTWWINRVTRADAHPDFTRHRLVLDSLIRPYVWIPNFLMPSNQPAPRTWVAERSSILRATPDQVRASVEGSAARSPLTDAARRIIAEPDAGLSMILAALDAWWEVGIEPYWTQIAALLDADIQHRRHTLHARSPRQMFSSIDRRLRWDGSTLQLPSESGELSVHSTAGLTLIPSAFLDHRPMTSTDSPEPRLLFYPARNVATLWSAVAPPARHIERLLGASRAQLLSLMVTPSTTVRLAELTGLAPASVSFHLGILRDAGLARSQRVGRNVLYTATSLGRRLLGGASG